MPVTKDDKINLNNKEDVLMLFQEIKDENPGLDELEILSAVANLSGWEAPPSTKAEGKKAVMKILKISE